MKRTLSFLSCALVALLCSSGVLAALPPGKVPPPDKRLLPSDIVEATAFQAQPAVIRVGDQITLTLTIKNVSGGTLATVPWTIMEPVGARFRSCGNGTLANLAPNATAQVTCTMTATVGPHTFRGTADPTGTLGEAQIPVNYRANNSRELTLTVPAPTAVPNVQAYLNPQRAKAAGAGSSQQTDRTPCPVTLEDNYNDITVRVGINCTNSLRGGKVDFELYKNFTLKNGWQVSSVEAPDMHGATPAAGSRFDVKPAPGSTNPYMKVHSWSEGHNSKFDLLRIVITGPSGTDPYR